MRRWMAAGVLAFVAAAPAQPPVAEETRHAPAPSMRIVEEEGALGLELAVRTFRPADGPRPVVHLAAAAHIADQSFYDELAAILNEQDVVLFEMVKPPGAGAPEHAGDMDDAARAELTGRRLRFLAVAAASHRDEFGEWPATIGELADGAGRERGVFIQAARYDGWGRQIALEAGERPDFVSLGADGEPGGEGADADLRFSDQKPLSRAERGEGGPGLQAKLATALGLVFQKDAMDTSGERWRNSDLSADQIVERLEAAGADGGALFGVLRGSSLPARFALLALNLISMSEQSRTIAKLMLVEMLSRADDLLESGAAGDGGMMRVILHDRNTVVLGDLRGIIENEPGVASVGIIYGAGHLPDLERRLVEELGYEPAETRWIRAIHVDLARTGLPPQQVAAMREALRQSLDKSIDQQRRRRR